MKRALQLLLGLGLAGFFLWLTLREVDTAGLAKAAQNLSLGWLAAAPALLATGYAARIFRWRMMLRPHNPTLGFGRCGVAYVASIATNNLLPFRAGDFLRCFGFSGWLRISPAPILATVLVERLLDMSALILALALALWWFALDGAALGITRALAATLGATGLIALLLLARPQLLAPILAILVGFAGLFGAKAKARIGGFSTPILAALATLSDHRAMPVLMAWSAGVWLFEGTTYWVVARAFSTLPAPQAAWLAMPTGTLSTLLPSTPGHIGTFDYFAQAAMLVLGNPLAEATAFVLILHAALWLPTTLAGGICLVIWGLSDRSTTEAAQP